MPEIESEFQPLPRKPEIGDVNSSEVFDSAFELGPLGAINRLWNRERFPADETFDISNVFDEQNPLHMRYRAELAATRSLAEFDAKEREIRFMEEQRLILDRGGAAGTAWLLANELLSPANLIPVAGVAGGLARSAARVGLSVGATVAAEEAVMQAADPTRTTTESALNVGGATILGGILGGAVRYMTPRTLAEEIDHIRQTRDILSVGAARSPGADLTASGEVEGITQFGSWLGRQVSPTFMLLDMQRRAGPDRLTSVAAFAEAVGIPGLVTTGTKQADTGSALGLNVAQARGGTLVAQRDGLENLYAGKIEKIVSDAYTEMALGRKLPPVPGAGMLARTFGRGAKMSQKDFREALLDAMNRVEPHPDKYINQAVQQLRKDVLDPLADFLVDTGVLKQEQIDAVREKFGVYYPFMYDHTRVIEDVVTAPDGSRVSFIESVGEWAARGIREDWEKRRAKALTKRDEFNTLAGDLELPTEEAGKLEASLRGELESMSTGTWAQKQEEIRLLREQAQELEKSAEGKLGPDGDAIRAEAKKLRQQVKDMHANDPSIAEGKAKKALIQRRLSNLNLRFERVLGKRVQKLRRIAALEAENVNSLMRLSKTLENYRKNWERWTPEVRGKRRAALANMFAKADKIYEGGEERIRKLLEDMPELRTGEPDEVVTRLQRQREEIFGDFMTERGPKGEKMLRITNEAERKAVLDRIDSVLEEGEYKVVRGDDVEFVELSPQLRTGLTRFAQQVERADLSDLDSLAKGWDQLARLAQTQEARADRLTDISARLEAFDLEDTEEAIALIVEAMDTAARRTAKTAGARSARAAKLEQQLRDNPKLRVETEGNEPPVKPGFVRMYHGGEKADSGGPRWFINNREYAKYFRTTADSPKTLWYIDVPRTDKMFDAPYPEQTIEKGFTVSLEFDPAQYGKVTKVEEPKPLSQEYAKNYRGKAIRVDQDFREWAAARGANDPYSDATSFKEAGERYAREYRDFIVSDPVRVPDIGWTSGEGNFVLPRLEIPYEVRAPFLVRDPVISLRRYVRGVVSQGLLQKRLGNIGANEILDGKFGAFAQEYDTLVKTITNDVSLTDAQRQERLLKLHENYEKSKLTAAYLVRQMRHQVGLGTEPNHWLNRVGAVVMDWNVLRLMGNVVPSSIPDVFRSVMKYGVRDALKGYTETITNWAEAAKLGDQFGVATDPWNQARLMQIADLEDIPYNRTKFEELMHAAATSMGKVNMSDYWNRWAKISLMPIINARFMNALETVMTGTTKMPRKDAVQLLAEAGIDDDLAQRIWTQLGRQAEVHTGDATKLMRNRNGTLLPNLEDWNDLDAKLALTAWVNREVRSTIITPDFTDIPMWMKEIPAARLIMQFRSFGMASTTKTLLAGVQRKDAATLAGVMGMLMGGALSYYAWSATYGPERLQEALNDPWEKVLDEAIIRSGLLAVLGDVLLMAQDVPGLGNQLQFSEQGTERAQARFLEEGILGPSLGLLQAAQRIAQGIGGEDGPTASTTNAVRQLTLYQNVFYLRWLLTQVKEGTDETLGIPETAR